MRLLLGVLLLVSSALALSELEQCKQTLEQLRIAVGCNDCLAAGSRETMIWSGGCSQNSRGSGWAKLCLDTEEVNQRNSLGERFYKKFDDTHLQVLRAGVYDMHYSGHSYAQNAHATWSTLRLHDTHYDYWHWNNHDKDSVHFDNHLVWNLGPNERISGETHMSGTDPIRIRSMRGQDGRNRLQVRYLGPIEEVVFFSGGYTGHRRVAGWTALPLNQVEIMNAKTKSYMSNAADGKMTITKDGFYRVHSRIMTHCNNGNHYIAIRVNSQEKVTNHGYHNGWRSLRADAVLPLKAGNVVETFTKAEGGNPYSNHGHNTRGHTSRLTFQYEGKLGNYQSGQDSPNTGNGELKMMSYGPSQKVQSQDFLPMKMDHRYINTMPAGVATLEGDDSILINEVGWFRVHAVATMSTTTYGVRQGKLTIGDDTVHMSKESASKGYTVHHLDYIFRGKINDKVRVHWQSSGENPLVEHYVGRKTFVEIVSLSNP